MKHLCILGSTGSIGEQTLQVVNAFPDDFSVLALTCGQRVDRLFEQIQTYRPQIASVAKKSDAGDLEKRLKSAGISTRVVCGNEGNRICAAYEGVDIVVAAMVGVQGLAPVISAIQAGKDIALANKETLVAGGSIVRPLCKDMGVKLLPVDSEHSAIWQCMWGQPMAALDHIYLTASGGPFRGYTKEALKKVTRKDALRHPTWTMGGKITVDSATMMNKGLEVLEATWLFDQPIDAISVVVHPQSIIHSMVRMKDGSVLAQMGKPDMMLPIQIALFYPERAASILQPFDPFDPKCADLHFEPCDTEVFFALELAYHAGRIGGSLPAVMNSANEEAVRAFLAGKIPFYRITEAVEDCMNRHERETVINELSFDILMMLDQWSRATVQSYLDIKEKGDLT